MNNGLSVLELRVRLVLLFTANVPPQRKAMKCGKRRISGIYG